MKGLLIKDLYMAAKHCRAYLLIVAVFLILAFFTGADYSMLFMMYVSCLCAMIPTNILSWDDHSKWSVYAGTLPCAKSEIVSSKYILGIGCQLVLAVLSAVTMGISMTVRNCFDISSLAVLIMAMLTVGFFCMSVSMPFMFRLGVEKGRIILLVIIGAISGIGTVLSKIYSTVDMQSEIRPVSMLLLLAAAAVLLALSWWISIRLYNKREVV